METRGQNPDDPEVRIAERERLADRDSTPVEKGDAPINLFVRRLEELAIRYTDSVSDVLNQLPDEALARDKVVLHIIDNAVLIGGKIGRLSLTLGSDGEPTNPELWKLDSVPNLLLLEALWCETEELLEPISKKFASDAYFRARDNLFCQLDRYFQQIPKEARVALAEMCADNLAPSPFVTIDATKQPGEDMGD